MTEHAVVIAGAGPTGLMLAGELALAGVDVVIVERRPDQEMDGSRAGGLHARTMEVLAQRGIAERFVTAGQVHPALFFSQVALDLSDIPSRHNFLLALSQRIFEPMLAAWVLDELGVAILREREVVDLVQDETGVDVALSDGTTIRAQYLVGCDGGRSAVRKAAGIDFVGLGASTSWMIAETRTTEDPPFGFHRDSVGTHAIGPIGEGGPLRMVLTEREAEHSSQPTIDDLAATLVSIYGSDFGVHDVTWVSRFTDLSRQAAEYRRGRVLVAGDAAHVHPPQGGQGLNVGVQDAVNLGWKLAQVVNGTSPDALLDTYHDERHPVGARVLHNTQAQVALAGADDRHQSLRELLSDLVVMDEPRRRIAGMLSALDVHYDLGEGHPLLGRRVPDLDLNTAGGPTRVYALLHDARPVFLNLGDPGAFDIASWSDRVRLVDATTEEPWELPVIGEVDAPIAVLIRPDGYVAWVGGPTDPGLPEALTTWFGEPRRSAAEEHSVVEKFGGGESGTEGT